MWSHVGRSTTGHFQPQACLPAASFLYIQECAALSQQTITSCSNSFGLSWCKMVSENHYVNRRTLHHSVSIQVSFSVTVTFSWNSALLCHWWPSKIQLAVALTSISTTVTYQYINLLNVMTVNDKSLQWSMQYFMWWRTISMTHCAYDDVCAVHRLSTNH